MENLISFLFLVLAALGIIGMLTSAYQPYGLRKKRFLNKTLFLIEVIHGKADEKTMEEETKKVKYQLIALDREGDRVMRNVSVKHIFK